MFWMLLPLLQVVVLGPLLAQAVIVLTNYTVDDADSRILYTGDWSTHTIDLAYGGSHEIAYKATDRAILTFTGVAIYFIAPLWIYKSETLLSLDGGSSVLVNLTARPEQILPVYANGTDEVVPWDIRWSMTGLSNTTHTLMMTVGPSGYGISDGFIFTIPVEDGTLPDTTTTPGSSTLSYSTATTSPASATAGGTSNKNNVIIAALAAVLITLFIVGLVVLIIWLVRRRRRKAQQSKKDQAISYNPSSGPTPTSNTFGIMGSPTHGHQEMAAANAMGIQMGNPVYNPMVPPPPQMIRN